MAVEKCAYLSVRCVLFATGIIWIVATGVRLSIRGLEEPGIAVGLLTGVLFCVPNHWTNRGLLFWARFLASAVLARSLIRPCLEDISDQLAGTTHPLILSIPLALTLIAIDLALPLSALWCRRLENREPTSIEQPCDTVAA